jgi:hypothetical protein
VASADNSGMFNWEAIGAVGEIVGAIAVVCTLIYLASQVRSAKTATIDSNRLTRANGVREMALEFTRNDELRQSLVTAYGLQPYFKTYAEKFDLSLDEASRLEFSHVYYFWLHWGQWASSKDDDDVAELTNVVNNFYTRGPVRYSWKNGPLVVDLDPRFRAFVNRVLADSS